MWNTCIETLVEIAGIVLCGQIAMSVLEGSSFAGYVKFFIEVLILLELTMAFCYCYQQCRLIIASFGGIRQAILQVGGW